MRSALLFLSGAAVMLAAGWVVFPQALYKAEAQPMEFNHKVHKEKVSMGCTDCHALEAGQFAGIPAAESCAACHSEAQGETAAEKLLVERYMKTGKEIPWRVATRQPMNVRFSHAIHMEKAKLTCERCHGARGESTTAALYFENRISGESRDVWGPRMLRVGLKPGEGMKMSDCEQCHAERRVQAGCLGCHR